ncbi:MAG: EAL domain-containing protein [Flavobacterium sp.]
MVCFNCLFNQDCSYAISTTSDIKVFREFKACNYWHVSQNIITRNGKLHGLEILSRPVYFSGDIFFSLDDYFKSLSQVKHKQLVMEVMDKIHYFHRNNEIVNYFINVERVSLLDDDVIRKLLRVNKYLQSKGGVLTVEVTQRNPELSLFTKEAKYRLKDDGVKIALDKFDTKNFDISALKFYDYIKFDCKSLMKKRIDNGFTSDFVHFLYNLVEMKVSTVAERVETKDEYNYVMELPFTHLQGFYEIKNNT